MSKRERSIPFNKITDFTVTQNLFEQILNLYNLRIQTAGAGYPQAEVSFVGLGDVNTPKSIISNKLKKWNLRNLLF